MTDAGEVHIIRTAKSWIEGSAVQQLEKVATLPGVCRAVGMPDLHPGRGYPIGAAVLCRSMFYPHLVGNDIGCGMGLWQTTIKARGFKPERAAQRMRSIDGPWDGDAAKWLARYGVDDVSWERSLGTVGAGNHFAEFQRVEEVLDQTAFVQSGLDKDAVLLLVHSGSRGLGESILSKHVEASGSKGVEDTSEAAVSYLTNHDKAVPWAVANRALIAHRLGAMLHGEVELVADACHNSLTRKHWAGEPCWLHRKGASPSDTGAIVVPGSRGSLSYLVVPEGDQTANAWSLAHGAGRKWNRNSCEERLKNRYSPQALMRTSLGSAVVCDDRALLYQEAPEAYKDIRQVIGDMESAGIIRAVATLRPLLTYKTRKDQR